MRKLAKGLIVFSALLMVISACFLVLPEKQVFTSDETIYLSNDNVATTQSVAGYNIVNYDVEIDASEGRKAYVTEVITVMFEDNHSHGILRDLNMMNGEDYFKIKVKEAPFLLKKDLDYIRLIIGDEDKYVTAYEPYTYTISYTVVMPKYKDNKDAFLYNVIPYGWDTSILNYEVRMTLPAAIDPSGLNNSWFIS